MEAPHILATGPVRLARWIFILAGPLDEIKRNTHPFITSFFAPPAPPLP